MTSQNIKYIAEQIGFDLIGITSPKIIKDARSQYNIWLKNGFHADLEYMSKDPERRSNPLKIMPNAKSLICFAINYFTHDITINDTTKHGKVSKYARGKDYHKVIDKMLRKFIKTVNNQYLQTNTEIEWKYFTDYGPILEKSYAQQSGIGFIGRNGLLITKEFGSYVFLATILTTLELEFDAPSTLECGPCNRCIESCPTQAITKPKTIDARRCISYQTIENKSNTIDEYVSNKITNQIFGCDICQQVCPWNKLAKLTKHKEFYPKNGAGEYLNLKKISQMTEKEFNEQFSGTPVKRCKLFGLKRNAKTIQKNNTL